VPSLQEKAFLNQREIAIPGVINWLAFGIGNNWRELPGFEGVAASFPGIWRRPTRMRARVLSPFLVSALSGKSQAGLSSPGGPLSSEGPLRILSIHDGRKLGLSRRVILRWSALLQWRECSFKTCVGSLQRGVFHFADMIREFKHDQDR
jgi:hypothetical protein